MSIFAARRWRFLAVAVALCVAVGAGVAPVKAADGQKKHQQSQAKQAYDAFVEAYLWNKTDQLREKYGQLRRHLRDLPRGKFRLVRSAYRRARDWPPQWWERTKSASATKVGAELYGDRFIVLYKPSRNLGFQRVVPKFDVVRQGNRYVRKVVDLKLLATWKPALINDPAPAGGELAKLRGVKNKHLAESIVWHELGHAYVVESLPIKHAVQLFTKHQLLFTHLQEFYADMTTLAHASPPSRRPMLWIRLQGLDFYNNEKPHTRAAHGIGALLLADMLSQPDKWPSVHFPPKVPEQQIELNTIIYVYENWEKDWTLGEAQRLREITRDYMLERAEDTLRSKGTIELSNGLEFALTVAQDRQAQAKRDKWVARKLKGVIEAGRADTLEEDETYDPPVRARPDGDVQVKVVGPHGQVESVEGFRDPSGPRLEIPEY
jgi:hypothetical protein